MAARGSRFAAVVTSGNIAQVEALLAESVDPMLAIPAWIDPRLLITESGLLTRSLRRGLPDTVRALDRVHIDNEPVSLIEFMATTAIGLMYDKRTWRLVPRDDSLLATRIAELHSVCSSRTLTCTSRQRINPTDWCRSRAFSCETVVC